MQKPVFVSLPARTETQFLEFGRMFIEVRNEDDGRGTAKLQFRQAVRDARRNARRRADPGGRRYFLQFEHHVAQGLMLFVRSRRNGGQGQESDRVFLPMRGEVSDPHGEFAGEVEFGESLERIHHGGAVVENDEEPRCPFITKGLDEQPVTPGVELPVQKPQFGAGRIGAVFREFDRLAALGRAVKSRRSLGAAEPRADFQAGHGVKEGSGNGLEDLRGQANKSRSRSMSWADRTPSASAVKSMRSRCERTGGATSRKSSGVTCGRSARSARALAAIRRNVPARVPTPSRTWRRTSGMDDPSGRLSRSMRTTAGTRLSAARISRACR